MPAFRTLLPAMFFAFAGLSLEENRDRAGGHPKKSDDHPAHILIIRHAEKTGVPGDAHLSERGQERGDALARLFAASKERPDPFPAPDFIFAATSHVNSQRPLDTVTALAKKFKLTIDEKYDSQLPGGDLEPGTKIAGMAELRRELFDSPKYRGKTILISWRHGTLPALATALGAGKVPEKWEDGVFDRVWQITFDRDGQATFLDRPQRLLPKDSEK